MALEKTVTVDGGVPCNYHRVSILNITTNNTNIIYVTSYINEAGREAEKEAIAEGQLTKVAVSHNVYTSTKMYFAPYDENMSIEDAYNWLKNNTEEFSNAVDVLE